MITALRAASPFLSRAEPTVRVPLPAGKGTSVSVGGETYDADADGMLTVPRSVQAELQSHLSAATEAETTGGDDYAQQLSQIAQLDAQREEVLTHREAILAAIKRARAMLATDSGAAAEVATLQVKRSQTVADFFRGLVKRSDIDSIDAQRRKAQARAAEEEQARELAELGVTELQEMHLWPLERRDAELLEQRRQAAQRAIGALANVAAQQYRDSAIEMARKFAVMRAHALELGFDVRGDMIRELPAFNRLDAFKDCPAAELHIALTTRGKKDGAHEFVDADEIHKQVRQQLTSDGLMA